VSYCIQAVITVFVTAQSSPYFNPHFQSIRTINVTVRRSRHILVTAANAQITDSVQSVGGTGFCYVQDIRISHVGQLSEPQRREDEDRAKTRKSHYIQFFHIQAGPFILLLNIFLLS
jgi:hypothetical protein